MTRPTFLSIICVLLAILGVIILLGGILIAISGNTDLMTEALAEAGLSGAEGLIVAMGVFAVAVGLLALVVVYFLWNGKTFGWYLAMVFLVLVAILGILSFLSFPYGLLGLLVAILLIWYFLRPNVREFFGV